MLERHHLRGLVSHSGFYSCEFCLAEGRGQSGGVDFYYPANWGQPLRTHAQWLDIATKIRDEIPVRTYGINAYSPLLELDGGFDIVNDIPIDQFHNIFEGIVKLSMTRLFRRNVVADQVLKRFNRRFVRMRTFKDSPRKTRSINHLPDFKGQ